jgi:hypothetical protein
MVKEKLTLSVDKEVVDKAKKLGINISEITEKVLKGYTSAEKPEGSLYDGYKQLFESITPLLKEFGIDLKVAEERGQTATDDKGNVLDVQPSDDFLESDGSYYNDEREIIFNDIEKIDSRYFLPPQKILSNLVDALAKNVETRKEKMSEILMAKRIIDAMAGTLIKRTPMECDRSSEKETKS